MNSQSSSLLWGYSHEFRLRFRLWHIYCRLCHLLLNSLSHNMLYVGVIFACKVRDYFLILQMFTPFCDDNTDTSITSPYINDLSTYLVVLHYVQASPSYAQGGCPSCGVVPPSHHTDYRSSF